MRREVELRVIEKPVVHPDRRFISLVHATSGIPELLSYYLALQPTPIEPPHLVVSSSRALTSSARRNKKDEKKLRGGKEGARRADARRGKLARGDRERQRRREGGKAKKKSVRNNARGGAFSRDY